MRYTIYLNPKHNWYDKLKDYSKSNEWSVSHAISHIVEEYFNKDTELSKAFNEGYKESMKANGELLKRHMGKLKLSDIPIIVDPVCKKDTIYMVNVTDKPVIINGIKGIETPKPIFISKPKKQKPIKKLDPEEYFAKIEAKIIPKADTDVSNCDRRTIVDGISSCYFFDNFKEYYPFCVKDCWGNIDIWKDKARKLKLIKEGE